MKKYFFQKIKIGLPFFLICAIIINTGVWRSLVARSAGGREVAGSNPVTPIFSFKIKGFWYFRVLEALIFLITFDYYFAIGICLLMLETIFSLSFIELTSKV